MSAVIYTTLEVWNSLQLLLHKTLYIIKIHYTEHNENYRFNTEFEAKRGNALIAAKRSKAEKRPLWALAMGFYMPTEYPAMQSRVSSQSRHSVTFC